MTLHSLCSGCATLVVFCGTISHAARADPVTVRLSKAPGGASADWDSAAPALSADGRYIAFASDAANLAGGNPNRVTDIFRVDRQTGATVCVSATAAGVRGDGDSDSPTISASGRYVAFRSYAANLVPGDTNGVEDVFMRDMETGTLNRISIGAGAIPADRWSDAPAISADGNYVAFSSAATNLVPGDTNGVKDVFVYDRGSAQTTRVSLAFDGTQANGDSLAPAISADGRYVAFTSAASNIVLGDANRALDVFIVDRLTGQAWQASRSSSGDMADADSDSAAISPDGRFVAFRSWAGNLVAGDLNETTDIFLHNRVTRQTERLSVTTAGGASNGPSESPVLSEGARYAAFVSHATNLVAGDTNGWEDVFLRDRIQGQTLRLSVATNGAGADYWSAAPAITPNGVYVAFASYADNLDTADANAAGDIYVRGPLPSVVTVADAVLALSVAGGLSASSTLDMPRLDVEPPGTPSGTITLDDAIRLVRRATGLDQ